MKCLRKRLYVLRAAVLTAFLVMLFAATAFAESYSFSVHNNSKSKITKILVSEDGKKWGSFDIGKGIAAGATEKLVWDESTANEACEQYLKAVFADGSESEPTMFDFCEKNLTVEFE